MSQKITMFFLIATLIVPLIAWFIISTDKKRKERKRMQTAMQPANAEMPRKAQKIEAKDIKELWGIDDIRDGVIYLKNGRYTAIMKVGSVDFGLLASSEQETVENILMQTSLGFSYPVQFFSTTDYVDTTQSQGVIAYTLENEELNPKLRTYAENLLKFLDDTMRSKSVYIRRNYIAVSYDGELSKAYSELARRCDIIAHSLKRAKITVERLNSDEIVDLIHNILNKGSSAKPSEIVKMGGFELYVSGSGNFAQTEN